LTVYLTHLSLTNFRNFARLDLDIPRGSMLLVGANAQGKTSLLEAVYYLSTYISFHASSDRQLLNFLSAREPLAVARIVADFAHNKEALPGGAQARSRPGETHQLEVRIIQESNGFNGSPRLRKEILLDGVKRRVSEVVGQFNAVLFLPQMLQIIEGAPEERRRYLNLALAQVLPRYAPALSEYTNALSQRNALLKQLGERGGDPEQLTYWDEQLVTFGAELIRARIQAVLELERLASAAHRDLTRAGEVLRLVYEPSYDPLPQPDSQYALPIRAPLDRSGLGLEKIRQGFLEKLTSLRGEEIARGVTTTGPHRDELRFLSNGVDLGTFGSRGQARTAMLAMKLAEVEWMKAKTGQWPVLLLDEVLAELDSQRRADLIDRLAQCEQAFLTTTDLDLFTSEFVQNSTLRQVEDGRIREETADPY
jgi:DNA replication and repair protein RecF